LHAASVQCEPPSAIFSTIIGHLRDRLMLAQGQTKFSTLTVHQQALTTDPFDNTCEANEVSPEVAIGGCKTQLSTTRGNTKWIQGNNTQKPSYSLSPLSLLRELYLRSNMMME
jgi:hypothetical protein